MKILLTLFFLSLFAAYSVAQCDIQLTTCEACLNSTEARNGTCGWCDIPFENSDRCRTPASCEARNGTYIDSISNCTTCIARPTFPQKVCLFGSNTSFIAYEFTLCKSYNTPTSSGGTSSGSATTQSCAFSRQCLLAVRAFACSASCAFCDVDNWVQAGWNGKVCKNVQTLVNNESCFEEIVSGCLPALDDSQFSRDLATCRPLINADRSALFSGTTSSLSSQSSSSAVTTATSTTEAASSIVTTATITSATIMAALTSLTSTSATTSTTSNYSPCSSNIISSISSQALCNNGFWEVSGNVTGNSSIIVTSNDVVNINGNFNLTDHSSLELHHNADKGTSISVTGAAQLGGTLTIILESRLPNGTIIFVLNASMIYGSFESVIVEQQYSGSSCYETQAKAAYTSTSVSLLISTTKRKSCKGNSGTVGIAVGVSVGIVVLIVVAAILGIILYYKYKEPARIRLPSQPSSPSIL